MASGRSRLRGKRVERREMVRRGAWKRAAKWRTMSEVTAWAMLGESMGGRSFGLAQASSRFCQSRLLMRRAIVIVVAVAVNVTGLVLVLANAVKSSWIDSGDCD